MSQEYSMMRKMNIALNVHRAVSTLRNAKGKQIHRLNIHNRRIIRSLIDEGLL